MHAHSIISLLRNFMYQHDKYQNSTAVCSPECQNGGECTAPGQCTCTNEWEGPGCVERKFHNTQMH